MLLDVRQESQHNALQAIALLKKNNAAKRAVSVLSDNFMQETTILADKWANQYRIMGEPFPGPWTAKYHPWLLEMLRSNYEENAGQKAAQMGYSDTMITRALYTVVRLKRDTLYVLPTKTPDATDFSAGRFDPALDLSPRLAAQFSDTKNTGHKKAGANNLYIRGSRSPSGLKSLPVALIILDEIEEMEDDAVELARERASGQNIFQMWAISTPGIPGDGINALFETSRQEHFFFKCKSCSKFIELRYPESLVITAEDKHDPKLKESHVICTECKAKIPHQLKWEWLSTGIWVPTYPGRSMFGPYINQLYSSAGACHPSRIAYAALTMKESAAKEQQFYNSKLGLPHIVAGSNVTMGDIEACYGDHVMNDRNLLNGILTLGIDVGDDCHFELTHWRFRDYANTTDLNMDAYAIPVLIGTFKNFNEAHALMYKYRPAMTVVDDMPDTRTALTFARAYPGIVKLCHYMTSGTREIVDHGERISVDRTTWLDLSIGRFIARTITLPKDTPRDYAKHVTALVRVYREHRSTGEMMAVYKKTGPDHWGQARNYSEIALKLSKPYQQFRVGEGRKF